MTRLVLLPLILLASLLAHAQAPAGFTLVGTTNAITLTFTDTAVAANQVWEYAVTAVNVFGESTPLLGIATTPNTTAVHSNILSWGASATATTYNVYRQQVTTPPKPPVGPLGINEQ